MPYRIKMQGDRGPVEAYLLSAKSARQRINQAQSNGETIVSVERIGTEVADEPIITEAEWR